MSTFKLPDLGEGLAEATVREWLVTEGEQLHKGQAMVAVETAKALVEVPSPQDGIVEKLFAVNDETIETGAPLMSFVSQEKVTTDNNEEKKSDSNTVVGNIKSSDDIITQQATTQNFKATPAARALARKLQLNLSDIPYQGTHILPQDVKACAEKQSIPKTPANMTTLNATKKAMALGMQNHKKHVVSASLFEDALISSTNNTPLTIKIILALISACKKNPIINSHYDAATMSYNTLDEINLGIAIDTTQGLYVPVIKNIASLTIEQITSQLKTYKEQALSHSLSADSLKGASFTLSNVGSIAGKYATPLIMPPQVAILAVGRSYNLLQQVNNEIVNQTYLPLSISFDHQIITGGEAARFLATMKEKLGMD